jgi:hypothetical protein
MEQDDNLTQYFAIGGLFEDMYPHWTKLQRAAHLEIANTIWEVIVEDQRVTGVLMRPGRLEQIGQVLIALAEAFKTLRPGVVVNEGRGEREILAIKTVPSKMDHEVAENNAKLLDGFKKKLVMDSFSKIQEIVDRYPEWNNVQMDTKDALNSLLWKHMIYNSASPLEKAEQLKQLAIVFTVFGMACGSVAAEFLEPGLQEMN